MVLVFLWIYVRIFHLPAMAVLGFWFALQFLNAAVAGSAGGGVAWWAHVGGFIAGMALIAVFRHKSVPLFGHRKGPWA